MHQHGVGEFPYYVGIDSLAEIATRQDRVCVLNILGTESRTVTPTSHVFSGGNVVFGTGPGKGGQTLATELGPIPVYNSVKDGLAAGHSFNVGVVYLPPAAVCDGVSELVRHNKSLQKIVIVTEKISVKDSRTIRAICQVNGIDVFGGNCLGVADSWSQVRLGGALGGNAPDESLVKGSIAIYSNSGNFTTTIATYLQTGGWGTTTSISSGKDVYIHFAPREFFYALDHDERSKAAVIYVEPGGYYEAGLTITKPVVACIVGRWKAKLTRACGHAGSLAGSGDDAEAKERWFMNYFGVDGIYTPANPIFSAKGAVVTNIAHIPAALSAVMAGNDVQPDFEARGDLSLKCWFAANQGLALPEHLMLPVVTAMEPYDRQIVAFRRQVGARFARQTLKDASAASVLDPKTQVARLHVTSLLEATRYSLQDNLVMALLKRYPERRGSELAAIALNAYVNHSEEPGLQAADAARAAGAPPNCVLMAAIAILGPKQMATARATIELLLASFQHSPLEDGYTAFDYSEILGGLSEQQRKLVRAAEPDPRAALMARAIERRNLDSTLLRFVTEAAAGQPNADALLGAIWATLGWAALRTKHISTATLKNLPWYSRMFSAIVGCSVAGEGQQADTWLGVASTELIDHWSFSETAFMGLTGRRPNDEERLELELMMGLLITNGPGTISAQGCKGSISADGPEDPERVQVNKGFLGFLSHTGFAHGGNGFEAIAFLLERFGGVDLPDPGQRDHGLDLTAMAMDYAVTYGAYKKREKQQGNRDYRKIPCINHPIFKGREINYDPRERYVHQVLEERGGYNIFLDFYHRLVAALREAKVSKTVYCVNVDAVIAVILLKWLWPTYRAGEISAPQLETAAFTAFLFGRMIGCAAEIDDHLNRGKNMDTRTPASRCVHVS